jgi:hypothetical protein
MLARLSRKKPRQKWIRPWKMVSVNDNEFEKSMDEIFDNIAGFLGDKILGSGIMGFDEKLFPHLHEKEGT